MNKVFGIKSDYSPIREDASRVVISYGFQEVDEDYATWYEVYLYKKQTNLLTLAVVKDVIIGNINARTDEAILSGFVWNEKPVWLSMENQFNYKAAYDLAVQTKGKILPITFKLGEQDDVPVYHTFETMEEFADFSTKTIAYKQECLEAGWAEKDAIDWQPYEEALARLEEERAAAEEAARKAAEEEAARLAAEEQAKEEQANEGAHPGMMPHE